jgi:hypothetical protein
MMFTTLPVVSMESQEKPCGSETMFREILLNFTLLDFTVLHEYTCELGMVRLTVSSAVVEDNDGNVHNVRYLCGVGGDCFVRVRDDVNGVTTLTILGEDGSIEIDVLYDSANIENPEKPVVVCDDCDEERVTCRSCRRGACDECGGIVCGVWWCVDEFWLDSFLDPNNYSLSGTPFWHTWTTEYTRREVWLDTLGVLITPFPNPNSALMMADTTQRGGTMVSIPFQNVTSEQLVEIVASGLIPPYTTQLDLSFNQISDLTPLAELTHLEGLSLFLSNNQISDLTPLAEMTNLRELILSGNQITDVSPVSGLANLWSLVLFNNPITNVSDLDDLSTTDTFHDNDSNIPVNMYGRLVGMGHATIQDALQILRFVVGLDSIIDECDAAFQAALIVSTDTPGIGDALQILRHVSGLPSELD